MRVVLINHCHPATPHICATRAREFARALAARGHRVALLTETLPGAHEPVPTAHDIAELLEVGGEPSPMLVACPPVRRATLRSLRAGLWPAGFQQALIAYQYVARGGMASDWRLGAMPYARVLVQSFRPDVVWATFGNTDSWIIGRELARLAGCPWIADIKDFWRDFIPAPLRSSLARRFRDAAMMTALSRTHAEVARPWFGSDIRVIYSGFPAASIRCAPAETSDTLTFTLTGSVYSSPALEALLGAVASWAASQSDEVRRRLSFVYCGNESGAVGAALARKRLPCDVRVNGFVPLDELQDLHRRAFANLYVTSPRTFHHKAIELLAARRPIVAFPSDHGEASDIAARVGGAFASCANASDVERALDDALAVFARGELPPVPAALEELTWESQAAQLEQVFGEAVKSRG